MIAQEEEVRRQMTSETRESGTSQGIDPAVGQADDHLDRLLLAETSIPWHKSFIANIKELVRPEKLPPLQVTSKPVAVKPIWGYTDNKRYAGVSSLAVHVGFIALLIALGTNKHVQ